MRTPQLLCAAPVAALVMMLVSATEAFVPHARFAQSFTQSNSIIGQQSTQQLSMVAAAASPSMNAGSSGGQKAKAKSAASNLVGKVNLFKKLPWNTEREQRRRSYSIRRQAATLYRELGIAEDATFEDINDATEALKRKYRDNLKKQIQVDVVKDKIMQLRLEQRMGGMTTATGDARAQSYLNKSAADYRKKSKMNKAFSGPKWSQGFIKSPDKEWRDTIFTMFGFMTAVGLLLNAAAQMMCFLSMIVSIGLMQSRGTSSEYKLGNRGKGGFRMFGSGNKFGWHTLQSLFFGLVLYFFTYFGAQFVTYNSPLQGNAIEFAFVNFACQLVMGTAAMYMQFYKGTASKSEDDE
jgi:hypothetical protein